MSQTQASANPVRQTILPLPGLEPDNLLAFLAALGLLEALDASRPEWEAKLSWDGPPWNLKLHIQADVGEEEVEAGAEEGIEKVARTYDVGDKRNVGNFSPEEYETLLKGSRSDPIFARFAAAFATEYPKRKDGGIQAGPLVLLFGQGYQNFFERIAGVPLDPGEAGHLSRCLFQPWGRSDSKPGFRWDADEDQRYALRFGNPSRAGAAKTEHGANRLATLGFLTYATSPGQFRLTAPGVRRIPGSVAFVWPVWRFPLRLDGIRRLLEHPALVNLEMNDLLPLGVEELFLARRVSNGKYFNIARATAQRR